MTTLPAKHASSRSEASVQHIVSPATVLFSLLLSGLGALFSNVLVFPLGSFPVTIPHILLAVTTLLVVSLKRKPDSHFIVILYVMLIIEISHALVGGYETDLDWYLSLAQFIAYSFCFVVLTSFRPSSEVFVDVAPRVLKLAVSVGAFGILQFALLQVGFPAFLPEGLQATTRYDPLATSFRYGQFSPAVGFATEPARFAVGLVLLLAVILFLDRLGAIHDRKLHRIATALLTVSVFLTFSITGILMAACLFFVSFLTRMSSKVLIRALLLFGILVLVLGDDYASLIGTRLQRIVEGGDNSSQVRVVASLRLLFVSPDDPEAFLLGTGLGMEKRGFETYYDIYASVSSIPERISEINIHNIFATVRFVQGWLGLLLYLCMLWLVSRPFFGRLSLFYPLLLVYLLYHFATGYYLTPDFWSLLGLLAILGYASRSKRRPNTQTNTLGLNSSHGDT